VGLFRSRWVEVGDSLTVETWAGVNGNGDLLCLFRARYVNLKNGGNDQAARKWKMEMAWHVSRYSTVARY
jgi:hypothetical protein